MATDNSIMRQIVVHSAESVASSSSSSGANEGKQRGGRAAGRPAGLVEIAAAGSNGAIAFSQISPLVPSSSSSPLNARTQIIDSIPPP